MARLIQMGSRAFRFVSSSKAVIPLLQRLNPEIERPFGSSFIQTRNYISEMRKSAFEENILRILRTEIQCELEIAPPQQPEAEFNSFTVEDRPGEQWIRLRGKYGDEEDIKIEVTMFDGSISVPKSTEDGQTEDTRLHISLIVDVSKGEGCDILEFVCSAWPDELEIQKIFMLKRDGLPARPYVGPDFKDLDDELQNAYQEFLEERGVNDELAVFLHGYMVNKDRTEFIRWLGNVRSFIEK
ncbi:hypothetical protein NE237_030294 [Protea cynaroides]|uniref:Mitochondrial glycoprotein n=1 Tax=Protea cynaroides TaxID=273540 RepID=A0A9Q0JVX6_9MAGN|nr:hypothetical protein NE237_030294 [Protea cynaroides]